MDTHELLSRIVRLPIIADGLAEDMLSGSFRSVFKGQGLEFDEARHYQWGDDARNIDWNASARLGTPFIKMYREERELTVLLLLDTSASMRGGTAAFWNKGGPSPYEQALIAASLIAFSAERSGQRVGALLFDREVDKVFLPRKGRRGVLAFVSGALQYHNQTGVKPAARTSSQNTNSSNLRAAVIGAERLLKRRSMVILISDFISTGWEQELCDLGRRHDVIAVRTSDLPAESMPDLGLITMEDPETGLRVTTAAGSVSFQSAWTSWHKDRADLWINLCNRAGITRLELPVNADAASVLNRFFSGRAR